MTGTIGIVLAGGNSTRFGEDKAFFVLDGKPMYRHAADALEQSGVCDRIVVSTNERLKTCFSDYRTVVDHPEFRDRGPLGGLYALSESFPGCRLLVVTCDTPYVSPSWLRILHGRAVDHDEAIIVTREAERLHPLIAVYQGRHLSETVRQLLEENRLSMRALFEEREKIEVDAGLHDIDSGTFMNINRKTDIH